MIRFEVFGKPLTAGSKKPFQVRRKDAGGNWIRTGQTIIVDDNPKTKFWKAAIQEAAGKAAGGEILVNVPILLTARFYFARPKSHYRAGGQQLIARAPIEHIQKPDLSKLLRALEDALKGVVYGDDCLIPRYGPDTGKYWTTGPERAVVEVAAIEPAASPIIEGDPRQTSLLI